MIGNLSYSNKCEDVNWAEKETKSRDPLNLKSNTNKMKKKLENVLKSKIRGTPVGWLLFP